MAAKQEFLSLEFMVYYGIAVAILGIYAIVWQQVLKKVPLVIAFSNKAVTVIWGSIWGYFLFDERITLGKVLGLGIIIAGIFLISSDTASEEG